VATQPLLSIITVALDETSRLSTTLESLLDLDSRVEHITVSPSNDLVSQATWNSARISKKPNFRLYFDKGLGLYDAMNLGAMKCEGKYVVFWNAGDAITETKSLYSAIEKLELNSANWGIGQARATWANLSSTSAQTLIDFVLGKKGAFISHPTVFIKRDLFLKLGGFDLNYVVAADTDLVYRMNECGLPEILTEVVVEVEPPAYAAQHHRRARVESFVIKFRRLNGRIRIQVLIRVITNEFQQLFRKRI
jgi:GT2 family glycosyltransferase